MGPYKLWLFCGSILLTMNLSKGQFSFEDLQKLPSELQRIFDTYNIECTDEDTSTIVNSCLTVVISVYVQGKFEDCPPCGAVVDVLTCVKPLPLSMTCLQTMQDNLIQVPQALRDLAQQYGECEALETALNSNADLTTICPDVPELVVPGWKEVSSTECTKTCGRGTQTVTKECYDINTETPFEGRCEGSSTEQRDCNTQPCQGKSQTPEPSSSSSSSSTAAPASSSHSTQDDEDDGGNDTGDNDLGGRNPPLPTSTQKPVGAASAIHTHTALLLMAVCMAGRIL